MQLFQNQPLSPNLFCYPIWHNWKEFKKEHKCYNIAASTQWNQNSLIQEVNKMWEGIYLGVAGIMAQLFLMMCRFIGMKIWYTVTSMDLM